MLRRPALLLRGELRPVFQVSGPAPLPSGLTASQQPRGLHVPERAGLSCPLRQDVSSGSAALAALTKDLQLLQFCRSCPENENSSACKAALSTRITRFFDQKHTVLDQNHPDLTHTGQSKGEIWLLIGLFLILVLALKKNKEDHRSP